MLSTRPNALISDAPYLLKMTYYLVLVPGRARPFSETDLPPCVLIIGLPVLVMAMSDKWDLNGGPLALTID